MYMYLHVCTHHMTSHVVHICLCFQQKFGIKTAGLDEKCTAMQMLVVYAKDLKDGFADFAEPVREFCLREPL